ncbi:MAG: [protein-PII] uridylyltransferase, partial [Pseudomonadota bacterium]
MLVSKAWSLSLGDTGALALVATGGYGRGELYPHSDIDLLVCGEEAEHSRHAEAIGRFFSMLWDSGLKVGQAVRSIAHCLEQSRLDVATYTSLLEIRLLAGNNAVFLGLDAAVNSPEVYDARGYFEAKRDEQRQRHAKFHNTADNLEPNLKEGPGGLRDFHTLNWLSRKLYGVSSLAGLVPLGLLGEAEWQALLRNWRIVARLRFALHLVVKRPEERLLFDHQKSLAELFGLKDTPDNLAVEQLMQDFFRSAAILLRINDRLLQRFEEHLAEEQVVTAIDDHFELKNGYLLARDNRFGPESLPRLFDLFAVWSGLTGCKGLHSDTARGLAESLPDILPYAEQPESVRAAFIALISHPHGVLSLQRLARLGILARYLPEFGQVTGRMQYDLFHVYTVDQHTLNVLEFIRRFEQGRVDGFSLPHEVFPRL